jgi:serine phosphatase RsbU (regulator of sigma subunit)
MLRGAESVLDSAIGEAFRLQRLVARDAPIGRLVHVPVSVRGQRLGVLTATFSRPPPEAEIRAVRTYALAIAHSLLEAGAGTDVYEMDRRHARLSVSAEMQWQLLPARAYRTTNFYVAGHLEPALRVAGDAFDFVANHGTLTLAVIDATATDSGTSLVTTLAVTALRNARRSGLSLAEQASLASDIVWQHTRGEAYVAALLLELDSNTGTAHAVDAGSPMLLRVRAGRVELLALDAQMPLGMFDGTEYVEEAVPARPGDRLYACSDGALSGADRGWDHVRELVEAEASSAPLIPPESIRGLVAVLTDNDREPEDDITVVCVDWAS